jgi:hypothetical protein
MLYIIYQITNKVNDKFYIGVHKTKDINDDYMGSGINIRNAIKKYGLDNFEKKILYIFTNKKEAFAMEKKIVNDDLLSNPMCYNIKQGGRGGFDHIWKNYDLMNYHAKNRIRIHHPILMQEKSIKEEDLNLFLSDGWVKGFSPVHLEKLSKSSSIKIQSKESRFKNSFRKKNGLIFIKENHYKWLLPDEINSYIKDGWTRLKRNCIQCNDIFEVNSMSNQLCSKECKRLRVNYLARSYKLKK